MNKIRLGIIGSGFMGQTHAAAAKQLDEFEVVAITGGTRAARLAETHSASLSPTIEALVQRIDIDAVIVTSPHAFHFEQGLGALRNGKHCLIEKPLATSLSEADELVKLAAEKGRIGQVGHLERFNPAVRATVPLITQPMFFEVHRMSVFTPRSLDIDVVLDLMIHDLDIVLSFVKAPVEEVRAVGLPILSGKTDIANVRIEFASGCVANFTASRVSTERIRKLRFFQPRQYISIDYGRQDVVAFTVGDGSPHATPSVNPQIGMLKPPVTSEEPLRAELRSFLDAVRRRSTPVVTLEDGRRALALALNIVTDIHQHGSRINLEKLTRS